MAHTPLDTRSRPPGAAEWTFTMTRVRVVLMALVGMCVGVVLYRLVYGLGSATNLSDRWPWGLWIWWDVLTGVALAGGGYSTALLVHFMGREKWRSIERGALLTSLIGYVMVCGGLLLDLGRWYRAWEPVRYWGYHSVMFELFFCVGGYTLVQIVEFGPIFCERVHAPRVRRVLNKVYVPVLVVGVILPVLHQSALGSLYIVAKGRLDPLWWTMLLPLMFLVTSFIVGPAMVTIESMLSSRAHPGHAPPMAVLRSMLRITAWGLIAYLVIKVGDIVARGQVAHVFDGSVASDLFLLEMVVGVVAPLILLFARRTRWSRAGTTTAAVLVAVGVALNRANVAFTGMAKSARGASYFPYWMELAVTAGLVSAAILIYLFVVENFPIVSRATTPRRREPVPARAG